jgi:hypothetical protein
MVMRRARISFAATAASVLTRTQRTPARPYAAGTGSPRRISHSR